MAFVSNWNNFSQIPPELLSDLAKVTSPTGVADYTALAIMTGAGALYLTHRILWDKPDPYYHLAFERPQLKNEGLGGSQGKATTRNIAKKLIEAGKRVVVFWGSQSGTAEGFAQRLAREITLRYGQDTMVADLADYDPVSLSEIPQKKLAIFIASTYGDGDPSDNATEFWDWITKAEEDISLSNLRYAAFGLGNSNYKLYNRVIDVIVERLENSGATALMPVGKANDAEGATEEAFMSWKEDLFTLFKEQLGFCEIEAQYTPTLVVEEDESFRPNEIHHGEPENRSEVPRFTQCSPVRVLDISTSRDLFRSSERHCLHMEFDLSNQPDLNYKTGDHLAVWPSNPSAEVDILLRVMGIPSREVPIVVKALASTTKVPVPTPTTSIALFRHYLEICAPVNRDKIRDLAQFAPTADAKAYLLHLAQEKKSYAELINKTYLNIGRLLQLACPDKPWSALPLSYLVETLPHMRPRYYSISSSSVISPRKPSITAIVSNSPLPGNPNELIPGVTSNYLLAISQHSQGHPHPYGLTYNLNGPCDSLQGAKVYAHLRRSRLKLPVMSQNPLIMVAAGTGLAPFRAFIAERCQLRNIGKEVGQMILFFGCRHPDEDFIYRDELEEMQKTLGDRLRVATAFSRQTGSPRQYVQDLVSEMGQDITKLLQNGANLYVCGRASMAREVDRAVAQTMLKATGWTDEEVHDWSKAMKRKKKWQEDVWG